MQDPFRLAAEFNSEIIGLPAPQYPTVLSQHRLGRRMKHIVEELTEVGSAPTIADQVDGFVDIIYIAMGALHEMGVDGLQHFYEVHNCNMQKVRGTPAQRADGADGFDAIKPAGWTGPDHDAVIYNVLQARSMGIGETRYHDLVDPVFKGSCPIGPPSNEPATYDEFLEAAETGTLPQPKGPEALPKLILVGHGRHGKDTAAEMLRDKYGFRFCASSLFCAETVMLPAFKARGLSYADAEACFEDRHGSSPVGDHRTFWFDKIKEYCNPDKARLAKELFGAGNDIYVGIRDRRELWATQLAMPGVLTVWVDAAERLPLEQASSMNIEPWMTDLVLDNNGTLEQLELGVDRLVEALR